MNNFFKRTLTAAAFVAILLGATYYNQLSFSILFFIITILGVSEFYTLIENNSTKPQKITGTIAAAFLFGSSAFVSMGYFDLKLLALNIPLLFLIFIIELYLKAEKPFKNIAVTLLGVFYVAIPFSLLNYILTIDGTYRFEILFGIWLILWSNDTGAYLSGSVFGKHKLFPRISPGKSWEGSIGGALMAYLVAFIVSGWYTMINRSDWFVVATILIVIGSLGDLVESLFKRSLGVKDSGTILPGHGGILDRFDSLLMAIPFLFAYLCIRQLF